MATTRGGSAVIAHGETDLRRYLLLSIVTTAIVAGLPLWILLVPARDLGLAATFVSVAFSIVLSDLGTRAWKMWPGSRDVVFNDLMLWGFARRIVTQHRLNKRVERLGLASADEDGLTHEERTALIKKMAIALETGDPYTHGHSQRVARHAYMVAKAMKLPREQAEKIRLAGVIHDVGKLRISRRIITKPGKLTKAEFEVIKRHTIDGARMVEALRDPELTDMVRHHHERLDGSGYPDRLKDEEISVGARILAVVDTFDAASSLRPYRAAQKHQVALDILEKEAVDGRLDPRAVDAFVRYYSGSRALRWWSFMSAGPVSILELGLSFGQKLGAVGLANAAVVGITAVGLASGHGFGADGRDRHRDHKMVSAVSESSGEKKDGSEISAGAPATAPDKNEGSPGSSDEPGRSDEARDREPERGKSREARSKADEASKGKAGGPESKAANSQGRSGEDHSNQGQGQGQESAAVAGAVEETTEELPGTAALPGKNDDAGNGGGTEDAPGLTDALPGGQGKKP